MPTNNTHNNENQSHDEAKRIERGLLAGAGLVGAAALGYYLFGPRGKKNRVRLAESIASLRDDLIDRLEAIEEITQHEFDDLIDDVLEHYASIKEIGKEESEELAQQLKRNWKVIALELASGNTEQARDIIERTIELEVQRMRSRVAEDIAPKKAPTRRTKKSSGTKKKGSTQTKKKS